MFSITGVLKVKKDTEQKTDSFKIREFVVTDQSGNYPQHISFQLTQDRTDLLDGIEESEVITVTFNIRGREWTSPQGEVRYFNSLDAWRIEKAGQNMGGAVQAGNAEQPLTPKSADDAETLVDESDDDLPF